MYSGIIASQVFEGLFQHHPFARPFKLIPALAKEAPQVSKDGRTITFELKRGVLFQDDSCFPKGKGREVVAEDFVYCFKRFAHPSVQSKGWWTLDGKILGLNAWREARGKEIEALRKEGKTPSLLQGIDKPVEGLKALGPYKLQVRLTEAYPQLYWVLAMPYLAVYPHEAVEKYGEEFQNHPVGTGPFRLKSFNPVYRAVLVKNETYRPVRFPDPRNHPEDRLSGWDWEKDEKAGILANAGKPLPLVDGMELRFILEDQPRWLYFKSGYLDFLIPPKDNMDEAIPAGKLNPQFAKRGVSLETVVESGTVYTCFNTEDPVLRNVNLRRALSLALDNKWMIQNLYAGQALLAKCLIPPMIPGFIDYHPYMKADGSAWVEKAKEFLKKAGFPGGLRRDGKRLRLSYESSGASATQMQFASRFAQDLRRIGIKVDNVVNTFPQMIGKMRKKQFQIAGLAWGLDYPDAQNILQLLYGPNGSPGPGAANFHNARFDKLYQKTMHMMDSPERTKIYQEMAKIVAEQVPWVPRVHRLRRVLRQPWLKGMKYTQINYHFWRYLDVDLELRKKKVVAWNKVFGGGDK
jgi:ABC-type transport system substrate-binding protein